VPEGEYSSGLRAIVRHVDAAIKHYERGSSTEDEDAYTDSVYRTNQAFEGALKEAFRVISGNNPAKMTLFDIENYLQNHNLRKRVLTQITRYREDYRNPSTHDYKLDFDESEALLAILSVTAFSKLLVDQIAGKIDFEEAKKIIEKSGDANEISGKDISQKFSQISKDVHEFLNKSSLKGETERENTSIISAYLSSANLEIQTLVDMDTIDSEFDAVEWDILVYSDGKPEIGFDIKSSRGRQSKEITEERIAMLTNYLTDTGISKGILVEGLARGDIYHLSKHDHQQGVSIFRIGRNWDSSELN
jgi:hypothetical protein